MAVKSSPRGKRSKPHCLEVELVKTVFGPAAVGVVEVGRRAAAVPGGAADIGGEVAGYSQKQQEEQGRLKDWCTHTPARGTHKRGNRGTVGRSGQKQDRKQRGKEARVVAMRDRKEQCEMLKEALQGASVRG